MSIRRWSAVLLLAALAAALGGSCGGGTSGGDAGTGGGQFTITIRNLTFSPTNLAVPPGATVTVVNQDSFPHSVTSQSAPGLYTAGAVSGISFDTKPFQGTATFTIPSDAPNGTVIPYFCTVHRQQMANSGQITIDTSATPAAAAAGGGGGYTTGGSPPPPDPTTY